MWLAVIFFADPVDYKLTTALVQRCEAPRVLDVVVLNYSLTVVPDRRTGRCTPMMLGRPGVVRIKSEMEMLARSRNQVAASFDHHSMPGPERLALQ